MYPLNQNSYYFYLLLHYMLRFTAILILIFVSNIDQHVPSLQSLNGAEEDTTLSGSTQKDSATQLKDKQKLPKLTTTGKPLKGKGKGEGDAEMEYLKSKRVVSPPSSVETFLKTSELIFEITFAIYILFVLTVVYSEQEPNLIFSVLYPLITAFFVLKNIYIY